MVLRHAHPPKANLSKQEWKTLKQLKTDKDHIIITADKGVALVVIDRQEYIKKAKILLEDTNTYRPIPTDPASKHKAKLINILKNIKTESGMSENTYKKIYPSRGKFTEVVWATKKKKKTRRNIYPWGTLFLV